MAVPLCSDACCWCVHIFAVLLCHPTDVFLAAVTCVTRGNQAARSPEVTFAVNAACFGFAQIFSTKVTKKWNDMTCGNVAALILRKFSLQNGQKNRSLRETAIAIRSHPE